MRVVNSPQQMLRLSSSLRKAGKTIGLVPTMGYLHEGHLSLIRKAGKENNTVVVSIFVNPTQFGPKEDYKQYPRDLRGDTGLAGSVGADLIFHPSAREVYPEGCLTSIKVEDLSSVMCGRSRPLHFEGVATVCMKLFNIVRPDIAYFGQKDYQQAIIIRRMVTDLNMGLKVKVLPIVREQSGLAMSSRNRYLSPGQKRDAAVLYSSLTTARDLIKAGERESSKIKAVIRGMILKRTDIRIDYIGIADPYTLKEKKMIGSSVVIALAAWVGKTRLIDNVLVNL